VLSTDPSLATPSSLSQHHDIPPALATETSSSQAFPIEADPLLHTAGLSPPSPRQSPQDSRLSPRTPEQETPSVSVWNPHEAYYNSPQNTSTSFNNHESAHQRLGYQNEISGIQKYPSAEFSQERPEKQIRPTSPLTSLASSSSSHQSPELHTFDQLAPQQVPSRSRRKHDRQFKCTSCSRVFPRRCDLK
jgi:hypothetical protein